MPDANNFFGDASDDAKEVAKDLIRPVAEECGVSPQELDAIVETIAVDSENVELPDSPHVIFDIETGPAWHPGNSVHAAKAHCRPLGIEYDPESVGPSPGHFSSDSVKVGNMKDPAKIEAKIQDARQKHCQQVADWQTKKDGGEEAFWQGVIDNAARTPITGRVLAVGLLSSAEVEIVDSTERALLVDFWSVFAAGASESDKFIGWNIAGFDVPFLCWRSAHLGVDVPPGVYRGRWLSDSFIDLMDRWPSMWNPWKQKSAWLGAKDAARFLGCRRTEVDVDGATFWKFFLGSPDERAKAIQYLTDDVTEETIIARRLGVI